MSEKKLTDWTISSSENVDAKGELISSKNFQIENWYTAKVPSTVLGSLVSNKIYENPYFGKNLDTIPKDQFKIPWWYRTEFNVSSEEIEGTTPNQPQL